MDVWSEEEEVHFEKSAQIYRLSSVVALSRHLGQIEKNRVNFVRLPHSPDQMSQQKSL